MGNFRAVVSHPITIVVLSVSVGLALHYVTEAARSARDSDGPMTHANVSAPSPGEGASGSAPRQATQEEGDTVHARGTVNDAGQSAPAERPKTSHSSGELPGTPGMAAEEPPGPPPGAGSVAPSPTDSATTVRLLPPPTNVTTLSPVAFDEVWAYLMIGEESRWRPDATVSDVGVFAYRLDAVGKLTGRAPLRTIEKVHERGARAHLVVASSGQATLLHFLLDPRYGERARLLADLAKLARTYPVDGFQLDLESLRPEDSVHYASFLRELRARLPEDLVLSIALPARTETRTPDAYPYERFAGLADRFFIMAYDQHWKGGPPGPISALAWCDRVAAHALRHLDRRRVVLGLPFYGRIWQTTPVAQATRYRELGDIFSDHAVELTYDDAGTHRYQFRATVQAEGWFEDAGSLHTKFSSAWRLGVRAIGFWRLGQEDPRLWSIVTVATDK